MNARRQQHYTTVIGSLALLCVMLADDVGDLLLSPVQKCMTVLRVKSEHPALARQTRPLSQGQKMSAVRESPPSAVTC